MNAAVLKKISPYTVNSLLMFFVCCFGFLYMYFLSMTVVHVVVRQEVSHDTKELTSEITSLESEYIVAQHRISTMITEESDLTATTNKIFVSRTTPSLVLSTREGG